MDINIDSSIAMLLGALATDWQDNNKGIIIAHHIAAVLIIIAHHIAAVLIIIAHHIAAVLIIIAHHIEAVLIIIACMFHL